MKLRLAITALTIAIPLTVGFGQGAGAILPCRHDFADIVGGITPTVAANGRPILRIEGERHGQLLHEGDLPLSFAIPGKWRDTCQSPDGQFMLFAKEVAVIVRLKEPLIRSSIQEFHASDPVLSPDYRRLVFWRPSASDSTNLSEVRVYNIANGKSAEPSSKENIGVRVYAADLNDKVPHRFGAESFYWTPDSASIVFADRGDGMRTSSIMLVELKGDAFETSSYLVPQAALTCANFRFVTAATVSNAMVQVAVCGGILNIDRRDFKRIFSSKSAQAR